MGPASSDIGSKGTRPDRPPISEGPDGPWPIGPTGSNHVGPCPISDRPYWSGPNARGPWWAIAEYLVRNNYAPDISRDSAAPAAATLLAPERESDGKRTKGGTTGAEKREREPEHHGSVDVGREGTGGWKRGRLPMKTENFSWNENHMRVLHPATRLTPENSGIPPFYGCC